LDAGWRAGHHYTVTYTHGWAPEDIPGDIKMATYQLTQSLALQQAGEIQSESIGGYSVSYMSGSTGGFSLSSLDRRVIKRVPAP
jgi:hypothetical protein